MKNIWKIFQSDMVKIATSWVTLVIVCGVIVLPPLYAWINIYASWDPYSNTKGIKVAVVNQRYLRFYHYSGGFFAQNDHHY